MLRDLFNKEHPFLMQALGGVVAVIIMIPIGIYVVTNVLSAPAPQAAIQYAVPGNADRNPAPATGQGGGNNNAGGGAPGNNARTGQNPGTNAGATTCASSPCTVKMEAGPNGTYVFNPATLTVKAGTTIDFKDIGGVAHNIVPNPSFKDPSNPINRTAINTDNYSVKLTQKGTFHYECIVHLPSMVAQITVQ